MHAMHEVPLLGEAVGRRSAMLIGLLLAWYGLYPQHRRSRRAFAASSAVLYDFLLNKWYFDELYDFIFVRPAFAIGRFFWKRGDEGTIDRFGPERRRRGWSRAAAASPARLQIGLSLHLCACDAARARRRGHLGDGELIAA